MNKAFIPLFFATFAFFLGATVHAGNEASNMSHGAERVDHNKNVFQSDPNYADKPYSKEAQLKIYGDKRAVTTPRPLLELGRPIYTPGPYSAAGTVFGNLNPNYHAFAIYGDWKAAAAWNDNGILEKSSLATQLNLDIDYQFTGTERIHSFIQPLNQGGNFTGCESGPDGSGNCELKADLNIDTLFFEGDLSSLYAGWTGEYQSWDLPFAIGLMPLVVQNGVWIDDAFTGLAATLPAMNSPKFDISNMDVTFFTAFDKVTSQGVLDINNRVADADVKLYGLNMFIEANRGYWEAGYAYTDGDDELDDQDYHNITIAHSRRLKDLLSNSVRVIWNFGQNRDTNRQNADGFLILLENFFITPKPLTFIPYLNLFTGFDRPQSLARAGAAGGVLKNTGINFETDNLTGFPKLDDSANNTYGGALGMEYLFSLDQQLVWELATVQTMGNSNSRTAQGDQYAIGMRYQRPLTKAWIFRTDVMAADRKNDENLFGARLEIRRKF